MRFIVRWINTSQGSLHEELADAASPEAAEALVGAPGRIVVSTRRQWWAGLRVADRMELGWWCRELRTLLAAGMTVVEALDTMHLQQEGGARASTNGGLLRALRRGRSLSAAMEEVGGFPSVLRAGVKASERTGSLIPALDEFVRFHRLIEDLRKRVVSAALYPALVVVLGLVISLFLLLYVIPRFAQMYSQLQGDLSLATRVLIGVSTALDSYGVWVMSGMAGICLALIYAWRAGLPTRAGVALVAAWPALKRRSTEFQFAKLYQSLAMLIRGGYPLEEAMMQCSGVGLSAELTRSVDVARQALVRGRRVSDAFTEAGLADTVTHRLLAVGERTGQFDQVLQVVAERHAANFTLFVERLTRIVEPVLLLCVAVVVGGLVVAMYMPVFDVASSLR